MINSNEPLELDDGTPVKLSRHDRDKLGSLLVDLQPGTSVKYEGCRAVGDSQREFWRSTGVSVLGAGLPNLRNVAKPKREPSYAIVQAGSLMRGPYTSIDAARAILANALTKGREATIVELVPRLRVECVAVEKLDLKVTEIEA